jgi:uncharacterized membrane protein YdjX (TVP38/TMEM64 family)
MGKQEDHHRAELPPDPRGFLLKLLLFILLMALGAYLFIHFDLYRYFIYKKKAITFIHSFHPYDKIVFIALQVVQVVAAPIPGEVTGVIGGCLYGTFFGTIYSTIGLTIGSWLAFILARIFGLPIVERVVKAEVLQKYDHLMEHQGILVSFILFLIPGFPKDCLCYIMGLSHMRTWTFMAVSTAARLFGTILLSVTGHQVQQNQYGTLMVILAASGVLTLLTYIFRERLLTLIKARK